MPDIFDRLSKSTSSNKQDIFDRLSAPKEAEESFGKSTARTLFQPTLGYLQRFTGALDLIDPASREVLREVSEGDENIIPEVAEAARAKAESYVPTQSRIEEFIEEKTGLPLRPKGKLDKLARLAGGAKQTGRIAPSIVAPAVSAGAQELGVPESVADLTGLLASGKSAGTPKKPPKPPMPAKAAPKPSAAIVPTEIEKLPSGLTKSKAIGAPYSQKAILSPERQEKALKAIDTEAADIAKKIVARRLPKTEQIQAGHDFETDLQHRFEGLKKAAEKANPNVDITEIGSFLSKARAQYRGIPKELLPDEAKKILNESKALLNNPQTSLKNLYRLFRINNQKRGKIYETRFVSGKQKAYEKFLTEMNQSIVKSFEKTFPEDSAWLKQFKSANKDYSEWINAQKTLSSLESVLEGNAKPSTFAKLAENPKAQRKLALTMGEEGSKEIIQLAKDVKLSREAIKGIPAKKLNELDSIFPIGVFIPGAQIPGGVYAIKKGADLARRAYGWYLTTPARRQAFDEAVKAIGKGDKEAYKKATDIFKKTLPEPSSKQSVYRMEYPSGVYEGINSEQNYFSRKGEKPIKITPITKSSPEK